MSEVLKKLNKTKEGDKIRAKIEHCNPKFGGETHITNLINDGDGWHFLDLDLNRTHEELSYNWNIIDFRSIE